jgi:hypothetical protein
MTSTNTHREELRELLHAVVRLVEQDIELLNELRALVERVAAVKPKLCRYVYDDGGQGRVNEGGGCVPRAIAIATGRPYREVYKGLVAATYEYVRRWPCSKVARSIRRGRNGFDPARGSYPKVYERYLRSLGWEFAPTKEQKKVYLRADDLPPGRVIVSVHQHLVAVIDGVIHDTYDTAGKGRRPVYGYYTRTGGADDSGA